MSAFFLDSSNKDILESLRGSAHGIVIFGAGRFGRTALAAARFLGLNAAAFCDNNVALHDQSIQGIPILSPKTAAERFPDAHFLIALFQLLTILPQLRDLGIAGRCLSLDLIAKAAREGGPPIPEALAESLRLARYTQQSLVHENRIYLGNVSLMVSERCSLRCKECSNLVPYFKHPAEWTTDYLLETLDSFMSLVDGVDELRLMGGDAMMHADIHILAEQALRRQKINVVTVFTNAVIPLQRKSWESVAGDNRLSFSVTDYGLPNQNIATFSESVRELGLKLKVLRHESWFKLGVGRERRADATENRRIFESCDSIACTNIYAGRVYRCAIAPSAARQGIIPDHPDNFLTIHGREKATKEELWNFLFAKSAMDACAYCTGTLPNERPEVTPAEQLPERMPHVGK